MLERARGIGRVKGVHVIHTKQGKPYAANTVLKAWKVAKGAGLEDVRYTIKDIRAMALTDAENAGYDIEALKETAAHTNENRPSITSSPETYQRAKFVYMYHCARVLDFPKIALLLPANPRRNLLVLCAIIWGKQR